MTKPIDLDHVHAVRAKGRVYYYFRAPGVPRERLYPDQPGFLARYEELVSKARAAKQEHEPEQPASPGSIDWLVAQYKAGDEYKSLSDTSRPEYDRYLAILSAGMNGGWGRKAAADLRRPALRALKSTMIETPVKANQFIRIVSALYAWANDMEICEHNPAAGIKPYRTGEGHLPWEENELAAYRARWPLGSTERTAMELLLGSVQRKSDVIRMARNALRGREISIKQKKTGARVWLTLPEETCEALDAYLPTHDGLTLLVNNRGAAFGSSSFGKMMRAAMDAAGLQHCSTHGLRYTGARRLYETGSTFEEVSGFTGHRTAAMAQQYATRPRQTRASVSRLDAALKQDPNA